MIISKMCHDFGSSIVGLCFKDTADLSQQLCSEEIEWGKASNLEPNFLTVPIFTQRRRIDPRKYFVYLESRKKSDANFDSQGINMLNFPDTLIPKYLHDIDNFENILQVFSFEKDQNCDFSKEDAFIQIDIKLS